MARLKFKCSNCNLLFLTRELALMALYGGCPGCGLGLYGGTSANYQCADGTEIPDPRPGPEPVGAILIRLWDEATGLQP